MKWLFFINTHILQTQQEIIKHTCRIFCKLLLIYRSRNHNIKIVPALQWLKITSWGKKSTNSGLEVSTNRTMTHRNHFSIPSQKASSIICIYIYIMHILDVLRLNQNSRPLSTNWPTSLSTVYSLPSNALAESTFYIGYIQAFLSPSSHG